MRISRLPFVIAAFVLGVVGAPAAQDLFFSFRTAAFVDIPITAPCAATRSASMTVYDSNPWIVYTCMSGEVVLRRYLNPNDHAIAPVTPPPPVTGASELPTAGAYVCPVPGWVPTQAGMGCVPPNHPDARRP